MASTTNKQPLAHKKKKPKKPSSSSSSSFPTMTTPGVGSSSASSSKSQKKSKSQQPRAQHASTTTTTTPAIISTSSISDSEDESTTPSTTTTKSSSSSSAPFSTSTAAVNKFKTMLANKTNRSLIRILPSSRMDQYPSTQQAQQKVSSSSASTTNKKKKNGHPATTSSTAKKPTNKINTTEAYDSEEEEYDDYDHDEEEEEEEEYDDGNEEEEDDENNDDDDDSENEEDNVNSATSTAPAASSLTTTTVTNTASNTSDSANGNSSGSSGVGSSSSHSADKSQLDMIRCACCGQQGNLKFAPYHVGNEVLKEWYLKVFPHVAAKKDDRACTKCYRKVAGRRKADQAAAETSAAASVPSTAPASNSAPSTVDSQAASADNTVKATPPKSKKSSSQSTSNSGSKRPRDSPGIDTFFPKKPKVTTIQESPVPAARSSVPSHAQATTIETAVLIPDSDEVMECPQTPGEPTEVEVISDTPNNSSVITTNAITVAPDRLIRTDILLEFRRQAAPTNDYVHMVPIFNASPSLPDFINVIQEAWRGLPKRAGDTENFSFIRLQRAVKDFSGEIAYVDLLNSNVFEIYPIRQLEKFVVLQPALES